MFNRLWNSRNYIFKKSFSVTVSIYAVLGFVRMFVALEGFFSLETPFKQKIIVSLLIVIGVWLVCLIGVGVFVIIKRKRKLIDGRNGKAVYVMYGDLFSEKIVRKTDTLRNICFAVNRCFDTIVNDQLIASASVHGAALNRLYNDNRFTPATLNAVIQKTISPSAGYVMLSFTDKPQGNLKRYEVGTAVDIPVSDKLHYFMVGLSSFNQDLKAETTRSEYCLAIEKTIEFCDAHAQGQPVLMPIIGGFLSRTGQSEKDLLGYMIKCLEINKDHINQDIYIVVRESAKNTISILDL
jgi:hypothetical protein